MESSTSAVGGKLRELSEKREVRGRPFGNVLEILPVAVTARIV